MDEAQATRTIWMPNLFAEGREVVTLVPGDACQRATPAIASPSTIGPVDPTVCLVFASKMEQSANLPLPAMRRHEMVASAAAPLLLARVSRAQHVSQPPLLS